MTLLKSFREELFSNVHTHKNSSAFMKFATRRTIHAVRMWTKWHTTVTLSFCVTESVRYAWNYTVSPNYLTQFKVNFDSLFIFPKRIGFETKFYHSVRCRLFFFSRIFLIRRRESDKSDMSSVKQRMLEKKKKGLKSSRMASMTRRMISKWRQFGAHTYWHVVIFIFPSCFCFKKIVFLISLCSLHEMEF